MQKVTFVDMKTQAEMQLRKEKSSHSPSPIYIDVRLKGESGSLLDVSGVAQNILDVQWGVYGG